jgi:hypothetical protein
MMNNILFTKKPNKQKNIENAVIYCIHIPLSQLITADSTIQEGKWGSRSIVTRYRLDSQFHCSYLESRGVPEKPREKKPREMISLSFPVHDFRWRHFRWCNFRWRHDPHRSPSNAVWAVPIYYCHATTITAVSVEVGESCFKMPYIVLLPRWRCLMLTNVSISFKLHLLLAFLFWYIAAWNFYKITHHMRVTLRHANLI